MYFVIKGKKIGIEHPPYIVAEMSANHNGSLERALKSLEIAKECGASAVKIQTYTADTMTIESNREDFQVKSGPWSGYKLYDLYKWAETPFEWHETLFRHAESIGLSIFSTPFDESAVDLLEELNTPAYKIASFELTDLPLLRYVAKTTKPIILSTGMASAQEITEAVDAIRSTSNSPLLLLHCVSSYPAPIEESNLARIPALAQRYNVPSGLSDHSLGTTAAIASIAMGACFVEKHFTINKQDKGPDSEFSIDADELRFLCKTSIDVWKALGTSSIERQASEQENLVFRRSIYFVRDLPKGHMITGDDIRRIRPGYGLPPKFFDSLLGRKLTMAVSRGEPTDHYHFADSI